MPDSNVTASILAEHEAAADGDDVARWTEQVGRAGSIYRNDWKPDTEWTTHQVDDDHDARADLADDAHTVTANEDLGDLALDVAPEGFDVVPNVKDPDLKVQITVDSEKATSDEDPDAHQNIEDLEQEVIVDDLAAAGTLYTKAGPLVNWTGDVADLSDGVDGTFLAERSKQTGEKYF